MKNDEKITEGISQKIKRQAHIYNKIVSSLLTTGGFYGIIIPRILRVYIIFNLYPIKL